MMERENLVEMAKEVLAQNMVMKEYIKRLHEEKSNRGLSYNNDFMLPGNISFTGASFIKVMPEDGPPFFLEEDDFYEMLVQKKKQLDREKLKKSEKK